MFNRSWLSLLEDDSSLQAGSNRKHTKENIRGVTTCKDNNKSTINVTGEYHMGLHCLCNFTLIYVSILQHQTYVMAISALLQVLIAITCVYYLKILNCYSKSVYKKKPEIGTMCRSKEFIESLRKI